jgi:hypothetical protein
MFQASHASVNETPEKPVWIRRAHYQPLISPPHLILRDLFVPPWLLPPALRSPARPLPLYAPLVASVLFLSQQKNPISLERGASLLFARELVSTSAKFPPPLAPR